MSIYTSGIPAECGRKMGGVVELNAREDSQPGLHGQVLLSGGSFDTFGGFSQGQYASGTNTFGLSASGDMTRHYLNPVAPENYTNTGTVGDFCARYERDLTSKDRLSVGLACSGGSAVPTPSWHSAAATSTAALRVTGRVAA